MSENKINRISEVLEEKGMKNNDLVIHFKVKKETVSRWVNNKQQPTLNTLNEIAEFLNEDIRNLLYQSKWTKYQK
ncbi:helix-turn-helix transcriptional regulator [Sphingobacterium sp. JUb56]|uniref:helix-turn-helix transcriptional regulator n=1 Tax=Sphingobacterium sp. JUb56 TaxID=2587145 RepID=UPI0016172BF0|nr:helix-turn-helix transcriptional regulator [Sphingobacterium sp. JUb56]MBB2953360.1 transcriptional regulator with XRE-family HTH domain [Sphingobacterium sp. JUb56]